ncbi:MAG: tryptophan-rich sensory protein, partial [Myxococcota bacterium]
MAPEKDRTASDLVRQVVVLVALLAVLVVNWMANALPIGGRTTGEVSAAYPVLFTPAGYAFSIWGLIYLALLVYAVVGLLPSRRSSYLHRAVGWPFVLTCGFNIGWIFAWHNMLTWLSLLLMLGL